jgi:Zn-dependent alcohol dehydrogenase
MIKTTIAAILEQSGSELVIDEISMPNSLEVGQVLVQLITSGICGAQINEIDAVKGPDRFLPHLLGHEGYATVHEIGPGVTTVASGDKVIMHWRPGSGIESIPPKYLWRNKTLNAGLVTTFNKHAIVSENRVTRIKEPKLGQDLLPILGCALTTALGVLENDAKVNFRDSLLIFGAGGVGLALVKVAKFLGVQTIIVVDTESAKIQLAKDFGASHGVKFVSKEQSVEALRNCFGGTAPTVAIDTTGQPSAIEICYEMTDSNARIILVGVPKVGNNVSLYTLPLHFGKSITGSKGGGSKPESDIPLLLALLENKSLDFDDFPTTPFDFGNINLAIAKLRSGSTGRIILSYQNV